MKNIIFYSLRIMSFLLIVVSLLPASALAQNKIQEAPPMKSTRTTVHRAVLKDTVWTPGAIIDQIHFIRYDRTEKKIAENSLKPDGTADRKIIYVYDNEGNVKEEIMASIKKGGVSNIYQYHYDEQGKVNGIKTLDAQRSLIGTDTIMRNEAGQIIQKTHIGLIFRHDKKKMIPYKESITINYNEEGQIVDVIEDNTLNSNAITRKLLKRDTIPLKHKSEGAFNRYNAPKNKRVDTEYDAYGNWIKRTEYNGANPEFIVMRTIEYTGAEDTDWKRLLLNGKVKTVTQTSYVALPNGPDIINHGEKKGKFFTCQFDKNGRKTKVFHFSDKGVAKGSTEYVYDMNGAIEKEIYKSATGKTECIAQLKYNDDGKLRNKSFLNTNEELLRRTIYRYDGEGNCIAEMCFNKDGTKYSEIRNQFDPYGNVIFKDVLVAPEEAEDIDYQPVKRIWNTKGRIVEEVIGTPENERHFTYQYSTRGEVISGTEAINNQPAVKFVYKFYNDKNGNWKKRIKFVDEKPILYEERVYTYYE